MKTLSYHDVQVDIDGAHNMPGIQALLQTLRVKKEKDVAIVFSCLNDRDVDEMIDEMLKAGYPVLCDNVSG